MIVLRKTASQPEERTELVPDLYAIVKEAAEDALKVSYPERFLGEGEYVDRNGCVCSPSRSFL